MRSLNVESHGRQDCHVGNNAKWGHKESEDVGSTGKQRPTVIEQAANVTIRRRWSNSLTEFQPGTKVPISSCVPFTEPYKEKESTLYSAFTTLCPHPKSKLPTSPSCGFWLCCDWLSHIAANNVTEQSGMFHCYQTHFRGLA